MRILLDTNIIILRENNEVIQEDLQDLMKIIQKLDYKILLHPKSIGDIKRDKNDQRRNITLSKFNTYNTLKIAPDPKKDLNFLDIVGSPKNDNDVIDNFLLFAVFSNAVNFLITEDLGIHKKAKITNISERVLNVIEALDLLKKELPKDVHLPPALIKSNMANLNVNDSIFDSLREDYPDFKNWYVKKSQEGRECWAYIRNNGTIGALLIYKFEDEIIPSEPSLEKKSRIKIATMKVSYVGHKIGELFLKLSFELAIKNNIQEIYMTHFTKENDFLVDLIEEYGFNKVSILKHNWSDNPEDVFLKKIMLVKKDIQNLTPIEISKKFYPNLYDGIDVKKYIIPIQPSYFNRLYTDFPRRQTTIYEHAGKFIIEGNTIKKAYLSHSTSKQMKNGDILLFYRSEDDRSLLSIGVIEKIKYNMKDPTEILSIVGKRTVYSYAEIEEISKKSTTVILFNHHFYFKKPIKYKKLLNAQILRGPPQSITKIEHEDYQKIKKLGGLNKRFTFN
ncbi:hypothetical protein LCGC14_0437810 [marine sediment metagenome]|uniref:N-acetyltransferase domain-containing protein n=1 Tax=marine sediment metagenome TaxID=412755 RepID=A0A0F9T4I4_9ZZZZ